MNSTQQINNQVKEAGWQFPNYLYNCLSSSQQSFVVDEFTGKRTLANYKKRLQHLGFEEMDNVLDAGCGMGQWSYALAQLNKNVEGVDIDAGRLIVATELAKNGGLTNVNFQNSGLEQLPFADNSFDAVFSYSVIMFTHMPSSFNEFYRVLKPGGKMYVMTDLWKWYFKLLKKDKKSIIPIALMLIRTIMGSKRKILFGKNWFVKQIKKAGFSTIECYKEGDATFNFNQSEEAKVAFYPNETIEDLLEVIAIKN